MLREGKLWLAFWSAREEEEEKEERESEVRFPGQPTEKIEAKVNPLPPKKKTLHPAALSLPPLP